jgi:hypothetical protein
MIKAIGSNMQFNRARNKALVCSLLALEALLAGCASKPDTPRPPAIAQPSAPPAASVEKFQLSLEDGITLNYQVEKKLSKLNNRSCFAFITGKVSNLSDKTLRKHSVLDIAVISQGKQLYRDNTSPLADIPTGSNAVFEMVVSPVFADGCPAFDKINIALRKVVL